MGEKAIIPATVNLRLPGLQLSGRSASISFASRRGYPLTSAAERAYGKIRPLH